MFLLARLRVQLFSNSQQSVASNTGIAPQERVKVDMFPIDNVKLDKVINAIAIHIFQEIISLNITKAIIDVHTISKLFNKEAFEEAVLLSPYIKRIGA